MQNNKLIPARKTFRRTGNRKKIIRTGLLFALLLPHFATFSQQLNFDALSDRISLPASESYNVIQDSSGFIWFATEEGYCRYSQGSIDVFDERNGIPEKAVYAAAIDEKGRLYVITRKRRILYFNGEKFMPSRYCEGYLKATEGDWSFPSSIKFAGDCIYVQEHTRTVVIDRQSGQISQYRQEDSRITCKVVKNNVVLFEAWHCTYFEKRSIAFDFQGKVTRLPVPHHVGNTASIVCAARGKRTAFSLNSEAWVFEDNRLIGHRIFTNRILSLNFDRAGNLFVGFLDIGLHRYTDADLTADPLISLRRFSVSGILVTNDNSIWCTTLEGGVQLCRNPALTDYRNVPGMDSRILLLTQLAGKVFCASNEHAIYRIQPTKVQEFISFSGKERFTNIIPADRGYLLTSTERTQVVFSSSNRRRQLKPVSAYNAFQVRNGYVLINHDVLVLVRPDLSNMTIVYRFRNHKPRNAMRLNDSSLLVFGESFLLRWNGTEHPARYIPVPGLDFNDGFLAADGTVYLTTRHNGIHRFDPDTGLLEQVYAPDSKLVIHSIDQDKNGNFWIGTNAGVLRSGKNWDKIIDIGMLEVLPGTETRLLQCVGNTVFLGTNSGLFSLPVDIDLKPHNIRPPRIGYFINKGRKFRVADPDGWFGNVTVKLLIPFAGTDNAVYYTLSDGSSSHPIRLEGDQITFSQLGPGAYHLSVYQADRFGNKSRSLVCSFMIGAYFYQTRWFTVLAVCLLLAVAGWIYARTIRLIRKREARKTEINSQLAEFQMSALQAQMNPHFIFNAINTIQSYILTKNKDDAYRYLTKFSNLIRLVLHNSQDKFIPLVEELEVINTYLELEQARFSNFTYQIDLQPDIDIYETMIPAMLIQPYLENAIWHGLGHLKDRPAKLDLSFSVIDNYLRIEVRDNGIGRAAAAKNKRSSHRSAGTSITQQRLETLKQLNDGGAATVEIIDLTENGLAAGTLVILNVSLPDHS